MLKALTTFAPLLVATLLPTVATAQPGGPPAMAPTAAADAPPQTEAWTDVSHINGQLVKVGERSEYLYENKKTNISSNPVGWMFGFYGLSVSHAIHNNVVIRGDANLIAVEGDRGYEVGLSAPIYLKRAYQGPFIEPGIISRGTEQSGGDSYCEYDCGGEAAMVGPEVLVGYHWTFDSGLNAAFAFGAARNLTSDDEYGEDIEPAGYFRMGYAF